MKLVALSTSGITSSVALIEDGRVSLQIFGEFDRTHSETVMVCLDTLLSEAGISSEDIDMLACDVGPGSFTGVRIGVCAANALAAALGKPVYGVCALEALNIGTNCNKSVCAIIDARNGNGYAQRFIGGLPQDTPQAVVISEYLNGVPEGTLFTGDASVKQRALIEECVPNAVFAKESQNTLSAANIGLCAWRMYADGMSAVCEVMPMYLRPTQAERLYKEKK